MVASSAEGSIFISDASDHHSQTASGAVSSLSSTASTSTSLASSSATSPTLSLKPPIPAANAAGVGSTTVGDSDDTTAHGTGVHSFDTSLAAAEALAQLFPSTHRYNQSSISSAQPSLQSSSAHVHLPLSSFVTSARSNPSTHLAASTSPSPAALLLQKTLQLTSASVGGTPIQSPVSASAAGNGPAGGTFTPLVAGSGGEDEEIEVGLEIMGDEVAEQVSAYGDIRSNRNSDLADPAALLQQQQAAALEQYAQHLQLQQQQLRANARRTARSRTSTPRRAKSTSGNGADPTTPGETSSADASYEEKHSSKKYSVGRCPHGKSKGLCLDCHETGKGGSSICHHKKRRSQCIQCFDEGTGGSTICKHRKQKYACRQCYDEGASTSTSMCKHRRERTKCKQCYDEGSPASTSVCPHRKQRWNCKTCRDLCPRAVGPASKKSRSGKSNAAEAAAQAAELMYDGTAYDMAPISSIVAAAVAVAASAGEDELVDVEEHQNGDHGGGGMFMQVQQQHPEFGGDDGDMELALPAQTLQVALAGGEVDEESLKRAWDVEEADDHDRAKRMRMGLEAVDS